ncbi:MAG TPA: membrane protein insertion efficiency factor YidD [bacterium]|nr:membrane protein insertion efficiency factor YidD [bacterium]
MKKLILSFLRIYRRWISPGLPRSCRFYPTCSQYAIQAIEKYGLMRGLGVSFKRVARCHPLHPGGFDPLP